MRIICFVFVILLVGCTQQEEPRIITDLPERETSIDSKESIKREGEDSP